jgi:hypothetical protein
VRDNQLARPHAASHIHAIAQLSLSLSPRPPLTLLAKQTQPKTPSQSRRETKVPQPDRPNLNALLLLLPPNVPPVSPVNCQNQPARATNRGFSVLFFLLLGCFSFFGAEMMVGTRSWI